MKLALALDPDSSSDAGMNSSLISLLWLFPVVYPFFLTGRQLQQPPGKCPRPINLGNHTTLRGGQLQLWLWWDKNMGDVGSPLTWLLLQMLLLAGEGGVQG